MTLKLLSTITTLFTLSAAAPALADTLTIDINGIDKAQGNILAQLFDNESAYANDGSALKSWRVAVDAAGTITLEAADLTPGTYGVRLMHDINSNNEMDTNLVGMPKEPYGVSNDARGNFGPATWQGIAFEVSGDTNITINLIK